ncbi:Eukaryotic translation initiation factor 2A [Tupaia chinensis]|uniref:Eukaryotic translation initiation factor 2A n=1 Tax=Tupaia chinensis TaxID=246437 RepID=L9KVF4_TUPCH|nr:Eukaryotic translation initiation factor 2A [Tupaia chinensis]
MRTRAADAPLSATGKDLRHEKVFGLDDDDTCHWLRAVKSADYELIVSLKEGLLVAVYVPGSKGAPSFVRLYQYPNFGGPHAALANKSFFKADKVTMLWNKKATAVLVIASTDVDKTGASYYGEQTLHYIATNGESAVVQLPKNGPIYDVVWNSSSTEFCAVYGFMPAKATVFNLKCDPVFDFGTGPRNAAYYSPHGHILVLAGFGNLRGQMEVWDVKNYKLISKPVASDSTYFAWCPDGEHILTATCAPRLRVNNGYKIWHYTGSVLHKCDVPSNAELWQVSWQPFLDGVFPAKAITYQAVPTEVPNEEPKVATAYRPPALRNKPVTNSKLHEEEPPQNMKPQAGSDKPLSKTALKNQRKHEAKKAAKQEAKNDKSPDLAPAPAQQSTPRNPVSQSTSGDPETDKKIRNLKKEAKNDKSPDLAPAPAQQSTPRNPVSQSTSGDPETDKKIRNLKKKLKAIEQLKEQAASGKQLEKNQLEKIQKEKALLQELEDLELGV